MLRSIARTTSFAIRDGGVGQFGPRFEELTLDEGVEAVKSAPSPSGRYI